MNEKKRAAADALLTLLCAYREQPEGAGHEALEFIEKLLEAIWAEVAHAAAAKLKREKEQA